MCNYYQYLDIQFYLFLDKFKLEVNDLNMKNRFTTLGSETSGGSIYTLNLVEPLDLGHGILNTWSRLEEIASFKNTLWTAEYDYNKPRAIVGKLYIDLYLFPYISLYIYMLRFPCLCQIILKVLVVHKDDNCDIYSLA